MAVLLALFAQPFGFPTDLIAAAIVALVLFFSPGVREFFGHGG